MALQDWIHVAEVHAAVHDGPVAPRLAQRRESGQQARVVGHCLLFLSREVISSASIVVRSLRQISLAVCCQLLPSPCCFSSTPDEENRETQEEKRMAFARANR
jgi:hypothetical protein